jgi:sugar/nucleoside kinase (ribokinase family)
VKLDVVCAGAPFLDLTFAGLDEMPALGEERVAEGIRITPGGLANVAIGLKRLGLEVAIWSPVGVDLAGRILAGLLAEQGIEWIGPEAAETPVSAVMPLAGDRAFVTVSPDLPLDPAALAALDPRAVVIDLPLVGLAPAGSAAYAGTGYVDARALAGRLPEAVSSARALIVNESEARLLSGVDDPTGAARALAEICPTVVVTLGAAGALCVSADGVERVTAPEVAALDTNGAGDLFMAAYVWADLSGRPIGERLRLATTYASLSVRVSTTTAGALPLDEFLDLAGSINTTSASDGGLL